MNLLHSAPFLRAYWLLPHRWLNRAFRRLMLARRPRWAVEAAVLLWARRARIDLTQFEPGPYASLEEFFLRRLRAGARPLGPGLVSPVDGRIVATGEIAADTSLRIKGRLLSIERIVHGRGGSGRLHSLPLDAYRGGRYVVIFLSPRGYHYVHMPAGGEVVSCRWVPGRYFPQNEAALRHIRGIYERNERLVLRCAPDGGGEFLLVMVGASLVGGIEVRGLRRAEWALPGAVRCALRRCKGEELGHFTFGSTVVLLLPRGAGGEGLVPPPGTEVLMGQTLFAQ